MGGWGNEESLSDYTVIYGLANILHCLLASTWYCDSLLRIAICKVTMEAAPSLHSWTAEIKKIDANLLWRILGSNNQVVDYIVW